MVIGVLKEDEPESRVSLLPEHIASLIKSNIEVLVESDAGIRAFYSNAAYEKEGASISSKEEIFQKADIILSIHDHNFMGEQGLNGKVLIGMYASLTNKENLQALAHRGATVFSMEMLPRTTRAQSMDILSSQANIAGYKAVLLAAATLPKYFPMFMTAAGTIAPAKVLILGAGVAGLQAIATAKRLGAVVEVFDTRPAVKEEVQSLGAKFIDVPGAADASQAGGYAVVQTEEFLQGQKAKIKESAIKSDVIITTAQIPGRPAPKLITTDMLDGMKAGSVIIDLAAATGGNTDKTVNNETAVYNNITIIGDSSLQNHMSSDASKLYGKNILNFLKLITGAEGQLNLNFEDDLVKGSCVVHGNQIVHERLK
jgi:NAD(P) transhydrogenase subunit alpha